jgi:predicted component of type VI protein secretion system
MKYILALLITMSCFAQDKPLKLSDSKVQTRLKEISTALEKQQRKVIAEDPECQRLEYLYRGLAMAYDSTLAVTDSNIKRK